MALSKDFGENKGLAPATCSSEGTNRSPEQRIIPGLKFLFYSLGSGYECIQALGRSRSGRLPRFITKELIPEWLNAGLIQMGKYVCTGESMSIWSLSTSII